MRGIFVELTQVTGPEGRKVKSYLFFQAFRILAVCRKRQMFHCFKSQRRPKLLTFDQMFSGFFFPPTPSCQTLTGPDRSVSQISSGQSLIWPGFLFASCVDFFWRRNGRVSNGRYVTKPFTLVAHRVRLILACCTMDYKPDPSLLKHAIHEYRLSINDVIQDNPVLT